MYIHQHMKQQVLSIQQQLYIKCQIIEYIQSTLTSCQYIVPTVYTSLYRITLNLMQCILLMLVLFSYHFLVTQTQLTKARY